MDPARMGKTASTGNRGNYLFQPVCSTDFGTVFVDINNVANPIYLKLFCLLTYAPLETNIDHLLVWKTPPDLVS